MKLGSIVRFELAYQLRRPWPWLFGLVLLVLSFLMARDMSLAEALYEDFLVDSPFAIAKTTVFGGLVWLLVAAPVAGEAGARDVATGMHPLVYTTSLGRTEYLGGRFLAALALNALLLLAVPAGILLGVHSSGVAATLIGPFRPAAYLTAYAYIALPNAFVATALQFALALRSGRAMAAYVGSVLLVFMGFFVASFLLFRHGLGRLLDPIGIRFVVEDLSHAWTTIEKSHRLLALEGTMLANRALWLGVAITVLVATWLRFRFTHRVEAAVWWRRGAGRFDAPSLQPSTDDAGRPHAVPRVTPASTFAMEVRQALAVGWHSFRAIAASWVGVGVLAGIPMLTVLVVVDQMVAGGVPLVPTTARVVAELTGPLSAELSRWVVVPLLLIFFAGELVWREREAGLGEITDAMPGSDWAPLAGKLLGLALLLVAFQLMLMVAGVVAQLVLGHRDIDIGLYLVLLLGLQLPEYLLFAVLALVVHVVVDQKYVAHLVAILAYVFVALLAGMLGIEHNLLVYGAGPAWSWSEMRGFGPFLAPWAWFKAYWAAWALLLAVAARLLRVRGRTSGAGGRLRLARARLTGPTAWVAGTATLLVAASGTWIFHNTNVRNRYIGSAGVTARRAEYERRYARFAGIPQPTLVAASVHAEIQPRRRTADVHGSWRLVNHATAPVDSVHVAMSTAGIAVRALAFDRTATLALRDDTHGYRIYRLAQPLAPGDTLRMDFTLQFARRGFGNRGIDPSVIENGTHFTGAAWFPFVGYQRSRELVGATDRRVHGLVARPVIASLHEAESREPARRGGGVAFEAIIGTDDDQVAVAPGALRRTWQAGGRRWFHYVTDAPIGREWDFFSARYAVHEGRWKDVAIRIHHHPAHRGHLDRVMRSVRASLDFYTAQLGPYPYRHLTIVEGAGRLGTGVHADASILSHGEGFPYLKPDTARGKLDLPYAVVAHEMAHQWTLPYAVVEGAPFLSEGLAWYSAMQVVRASRGEGELRRLLAFMRRPHPYPAIRRGEPLLRALDPYLAYRKGPFAMHAMSRYIGADRVNGALRRLVARHEAADAPAATTLDLYRELRAATPDSLHPLLHDLFEVNTVWDLRTERVDAVPVAGGAWQVTLQLRARKTVYDSAGVEREVPMDEWVEVGVFAAGGPEGELSTPLHVAKHRIRSGTHAITVTVPGRPVLAGIDPFHLLDWVEDGDDDNIDVIRIE